MSDFNSNPNNTSDIPAYLRYPDDPISEKMFADSMVSIENERCNYRFMLYSEIADPIPVIEQQSPQFDRNEIHYYLKEDAAPWYSISTMKHESVLKNDPGEWVEGTDRIFTLMGATDLLLRVPEKLRGAEYKKVSMFNLGESAAYNKLHGFDASNVYCHVFYLGEQLYKKFILVTKKHDWTWRVEVNIPSEYEQVISPDFVPAGQTFGSFGPLETADTGRYYTAKNAMKAETPAGYQKALRLFRRILGRKD